MGVTASRSNLSPTSDCKGQRLDTDAFSDAVMDDRGYGHRKGSVGSYTIVQSAHDAPVMVMGRLGRDAMTM